MAEADSVHPGFAHLSVLWREVLIWSAVSADLIGVDVTLGGGGHSAGLLDAGIGRLIGLDRDQMALDAATQRLASYGERFEAVHAPFSQLPSVLEARFGRSEAVVDRVIADLGVSSPQLDIAERGFSFQKEGPLDMRMDRSRGSTAAQLVAEWSAEDLEDVFRRLGEERFAGRIARGIVSRRARKAFETTADLASYVASVVPKTADSRRIHPATRVFQALRMAVNDELGELERLLEAAFVALKPGGRLLVISFHSLEDRPVKHFFRARAVTCICPPTFPVCNCGTVAQATVLTPAGVVAAADELELNPRARSARLRVLEKRGIEPRRG